MEEELNDLHHLSSVVFTNIGGITPNIKNLIAHGKAFHKSYQGTIALGTQFIQSLGAFAQSALEAKGATHSVGEALNDIMNIFCEIESMKGDLMNVFLNDVIVPLDNRAEQEVNMSKLAYKQYLQDNKVQTEAVAKLAQDIVKLRKKSQKKKGKAGKYEKREEELLEEFESEEKQLRTVREQGLRRALIGERRIYCFVADRLSSFGRGLAVHSNRISSMLNEKLDVWNTVVSNPSELPAESENVVQNPSVHYTATIRRKKQNITSPVRSNTMESSSRPSAIGKEAFDTIHENETPGDSEPQRRTSVDGVGESVVQSNGVNADHEVDRGDAKVTNGKGYVRHSMMPAASNHMELAPSTDNTPQLRAIYSHTGKDSSQLSFSKGDLIFKLSPPTGGWQYGKHQITEKSGWFPAAYVENMESLPVANPIALALQDVAKSIPQLRENGPSRRFSTPTSTSPYIPAPDYDGASDSIAIGNGNVRKEELHVSTSAPGLASSQLQNITRVGPELNAPPPPFAYVAAVSAPGNIQDNGPEGDFVAMPFPPPPPTLGGDELSEEPSNPFADIKLKKAVTNDRSMPKIS